MSVTVCAHLVVTSVASHEKLERTYLCVHLYACLCIMYSITYQVPNFHQFFVFFFSNRTVAKVSLSDKIFHH